MLFCSMLKHQSKFYLLYACFDHLKMAGSELSSNTTNNGIITKIECAVCLQTSVHPAELPCGHVFCYLCIKGIVNQGRRCAMCRQDIPVDYLDKPKLLNPMDAEVTSQGFEDGHLWFYEGHNGWWQYDERSSIELESAYQKGERCCDLLIAGFLYIADFDGMIQYRRNDPSRRRRIKRDLATTSKKGIAGLKATKSYNLAPSSSPEIPSNEMNQNLSVSSSATNLSNIRIHTSAANNSGQHIGGRQGLQQSQRPDGLSQCSTSTHRSAQTSNLNGVSQVEHPSPAFRNLNLDNVLHDSLDWTIEQIESLNLELLNDYEALFRDVNNYGQLQDTLTQSRPRRACNYMSRYLNTSNPPSHSLQNENVSTDVIPNLSNYSNMDDLNNLSFESSPNSLVETNPIYSEETETLSPTQSRATSPPQPPPRIRGMSRSGSKIDSLRHPSLS